MSLESGVDAGGLFPVVPTENRNFATEYIVQLHPNTFADEFPDTSQDEFLQISYPPVCDTEIHARVQASEDIPEGAIGLDFTVRNALSTPSELEVEHGTANAVACVTVAPMKNPEQRWKRRRLNQILGVRPQVCRMRMGVFPDLEDKICRLPKNTMEIIGVENGDNVTIESTRGARIVRGVKVFEIDEERDETKETQKELNEDRYPRCEKMLQLDRIRGTEVDIPEIWCDQEVRSRLGLLEAPKNGVCQPVRVYRDSWYLLQQMFHELMIPLVVVLVAAGFEIQGTVPTVTLWVAAILLWTVALAIESHSRLT